MRSAGLPVPKLIVLKSPYRFVVNPLFEFALDVEAKNPDRQIAVVVPELCLGSA